MVQRYDECEWCGDEYSPDAGMTKAEKGDYIKYADYEKLINNHEKLEKVLKELRASDNWLHRLLKSCVIFLDDGEVTKRAVEKQSRYNQQALEDAEKPK